MRTRNEVFKGKKMQRASALIAGAMLAGVPVAFAADEAGSTTKIETTTKTTVQQEPATDRTQGQPQDSDLLQRRASDNDAQNLQLEADARAETSSQRMQAGDRAQQRQQDQRIQYGAPDNAQSGSVFTADMNDDGKQTTVQGRVINIESYLKHGEKVALDSNDSRSQINDNSPVGLLTDEGDIIVLLSSDDGGFFAESQASNDSQLRNRFSQNEQQGQLTNSILNQQRANEYNLRAEDRLANASDNDQQTEYRAEPYRADTTRQQAKAKTYTTTETHKTKPVARRVGPLHHDVVAQRGPTEQGLERTITRTQQSGSVQQAAPEDRSSTRYSADTNADSDWSHQDLDHDHQQKMASKDGSNKHDKMAKSDKSYNQSSQSRQVGTVSANSSSSQDIIANSSSVSLAAHDRHMRNNQSGSQFSQSGSQFSQNNQNAQNSQGQSIQWGSNETQSNTQYRANRSGQSLSDRQALQAGNRVEIDGRLYERQDEQGIVPQSIRLANADRASQSNQNQMQRSNQSQTQIRQSSQDRNQQWQTQADTNADLEAGASIDADSGAEADVELNSDSTDQAQPAVDMTQGKPQDADLLQRRSQDVDLNQSDEPAEEIDVEADVDADVDTDNDM